MKLTKKTTFILIMLLTLSLSLSMVTALNLDVGCPNQADFSPGGTVTCTVKNPLPAPGVTLASLSIDEVSGGASFSKLEPLAGSLKLFQDNPLKSGFTGAAVTSSNLFKITLTMNSATPTSVTLKDVVMKSADGTTYQSSDGGITLTGNTINLVQCQPNCAGKTCGSDGCGGTCGACSNGQTCQLGICQEPQQQSQKQNLISAITNCINIHYPSFHSIVSCMAAAFKENNELSWI